MIADSVDFDSKRFCVRFRLIRLIGAAESVQTQSSLSFWNSDERQQERYVADSRLDTEYHACVNGQRRVSVCGVRIDCVLAVLRSRC